MKISPRRKNQRLAFALPRPKRPCLNCGQPGSHFLGPSFGEPGMWMCEAFLKPLDTPAEGGEQNQ
jgi:hypothetical protein